MIIKLKKQTLFFGFGISLAVSLSFLVVDKTMLSSIKRDLIQIFFSTDPGFTSLMNLIDEGDAKFNNYYAEDFYVFAATGTKDIAYENLSPQIASMRNLEVFKYGLDREENNLYYLEIEDAVHTNEWYFEYVYNILPFFFGK